jgi:tetratricopeptide (TPR) repeat protein
MIHMAALAAAEGRSIARADQLFDYILSREAEIWMRAAKALDLDLSADALRQAIALLTLTQGAADGQEAESFLRHAPLLKDLTTDPLHRVLRLVRGVYPGAGADLRCVEPLRPDLLGEELIDRALEPWPELLDTAPDIARYRALAVMGRLALRRMEAGLPLSYERLQKLERALPEHTIALREVAALILGQMHAWLVAVPRPWPEEIISEFARVSANLASWLIALGRREDALAAAEEAVRLRRTLAAARPDPFNPDLAGSLAVLANCLEAVEQSSEALAANREAIALLRAPFLRHPAAFAHWMAPMCELYIGRCETLGQEPDAELLGPVVEALQRMPQGQPSAAMAAPG